MILYLPQSVGQVCDLVGWPLSGWNVLKLVVRKQVGEAEMQSWDIKNTSLTHFQWLFV